MTKIRIIPIFSFFVCFFGFSTYQLQAEEDKVTCPYMDYHHQHSSEMESPEGWTEYYVYRPEEFLLEGGYIKYLSLTDTQIGKLARLRSEYDEKQEKTERAIAYLEKQVALYSHLLKTDSKQASQNLDDLIKSYRDLWNLKYDAMAQIKKVLTDDQVKKFSFKDKTTPKKEK